MTDPRVGIVMATIALPAIVMAILPGSGQVAKGAKRSYRAISSGPFITIAAPFVVAAVAIFRRTFVMFDPGAIIMLAFVLQILTLPPAVVLLWVVASKNRGTPSARWSSGGLVLAAIYACILVFELLNFEMH